MDRPRVFLVVSTGQNVANLPPVLEHASPGDLVQWIESDEAQRRCWSDGASKVFRKFGLHLSSTIRVPSVNDPAELAQACDIAIKTWAQCHAELYLVANGGNKLAPFWLWLAWRDLHPAILYGDDRPAVCHTYRLVDPPHGSWCAQQHAHRCHRLDLEEILEATGHFIHNEGTATRFWPGELPHDAANERYAADPAEVRRLHAKHFRKIRKRLFSELGLAFERAVVRRVHAYLQSRRPSCVQSARHRVSIAAQSDPSRVVAEFDVVLVLKNGILLHLECKTAPQVDQKDLDARLLNLQESGSRLAQMALCIPLYTQFIGERWAVRYHDLRVRMERRRRFPMVLLTLPGQPSQYTAPDERGEPQTYSCPALEECLDALLAPYEPSDAATAP